MSVCLSVSLSLSLCFCIFWSLCLSLCFCICLYISLSDCVSLSVCLSLYLSVCLLVSPSDSVFYTLSIYTITTTCPSPCTHVKWIILYQWCYTYSIYYIWYILITHLAPSHYLRSAALVAAAAHALGVLKRLPRATVVLCVILSHLLLATRRCGCNKIWCENAISEKPSLTGPPSRARVG